VRSNYVQFKTPQFSLLSEQQKEEIHLAVLQILEKTGVAFYCQEAVNLLGEAGADVSDPMRVKIPSCLVEQALRTAPKTITLYTREGEPAMVLNGMTGAHFGAMSAVPPKYLDPCTRKARNGYVEDVADTARVIDALPNIEWTYTVGGCPALHGDLDLKVSALQAILNSSKPLTSSLNNVSMLKDILEVCSVVAGGEKLLKAKPFFFGAVEPVSPLVQGKDALEKSLLCAERGIPNVVYGMQMAGATTPATFPATLAIGIAECLSHLVVIQLKKPGAPVIFGALPGIMDMKTMIFSYDAPEVNLLVTTATEMSHYYKLPMFGNAGITDSEEIDIQTATVITYQVLVSALSGADLVHNVGAMSQGKMGSPELIVLTDEVVEMAKVLMGGLEINEETLPLDLIERVGPGGQYLSQSHTLKHFRKFMVPTIFDRTPSMVRNEGIKHSGDLLNEKTLRIMNTHQPKPLPEGMVRELKGIEKTWFNRLGLKHEYPPRE